MQTQIKAEICKVKTSRLFYLLAASFVVCAGALGVVLIVGDTSVMGEMPYLTFETALLFALSDVAILTVPAVFISYFIGGDFSNRTINNEIRIGRGRFAAVASRAAVAIAFAVIIYFAFAFPFALFMGLRNGFELKAFSVAGLGLRVLLFTVQIAAVLSLNVFVMFACKKSSLGLAINVCFTNVAPFLLNNVMYNNEIYKLTVFCQIMQSGGALETREVVISFVSAIATLILAIIASYAVFRKAELK